MAQHHVPAPLCSNRRFPSWTPLPRGTKGRWERTAAPPPACPLQGDTKQMKEFYLVVSTGVDCDIHVTHVQHVTSVLSKDCGVCEYMRSMYHSWRSKTLITNEAKGWRSGDGTHTGSGLLQQKEISGRLPSPNASWDICEHKRTPDQRLKVNQRSLLKFTISSQTSECGVLSFSREKMPLMFLGNISCNGMSHGGAEEWNSRRPTGSDITASQATSSCLKFPTFKQQDVSTSAPRINDRKQCRTKVQTLSLIRKNSFAFL